MKVMELKQYINGKFHTPVSGRYKKNRNPATGDIISKVPLGDKSDVDAAVYAAKNALPEWSAKSVDERANILEKIANIIESRKKQLAELESLDTGKPIRLAFETDITRAIANFRFFAGAARHDELGFHKMKNAINYTLRKPLGVVALITPWNLPIYLLSWKTAPALVMGNTIVAKPSSMTPLTASALTEIMNEAGLPNGVFNLVHGSGSKVGKPLSLHRDVSAVSFTGSTDAGAKVSEAASSTFKKISLELGGKNPTIVFADADIKKAVNGAVKAAFTNQGQVCLCGSRILVEQTIHDRFLEELVKTTKKMKIGNPSDKNVDLGAVISHEHRDKVEEYIRLGIEEGTVLDYPLIEYCLKDDKLGDPIISSEHILNFKWLNITELDLINNQCLRINDYLQGLFRGIGIKLVDFKVEFGKTKSNETIILADEISPDTCRLWDQETDKKLDKDRFRKDLGNIVEAYQEVARRLGILHEQSNIRPIKFSKPTAVKIKKNK